MRPWPRITVVGSVNLDLVAAAASGCRDPARPSPARPSSASRAARGRTRRSPCARLGAEVRWSRRSAATPSRTRRSPGCARRGSSSTCAASSAPTGVALIHGRRRRRDDDRGRVRARTRSSRTSSCRAADAVLCQLEIPDEAVISAWEQARRLFCLNAAPARPRLSRRRPRRRQPLRARGARATRRARRRSRSAPRERPAEDGEEVARAAPPVVDGGGRHGGGRRVHRVPARLAARGARARGGAAPRVRGRCARRLALRRAAVASHGGRDRRRPALVTQ